MDIRYYYNKDRLIDEEKRDVVAGDHKELLEQMDEIQRQHDERLHIAETRYNYTKKCAAVEFEATKESCNTQLFVCYALQSNVMTFLIGSKGGFTLGFDEGNIWNAVTGSGRAR